MKTVLRHISSCELYANCTFPQCNISKELIKHWQKCNQTDCSLCMPIKTDQTKNNTSDVLSGKECPSTKPQGKIDDQNFKFIPHLSL